MSNSENNAERKLSERRFREESSRAIICTYNSLSQDTIFRNSRLRYGGSFRFCYTKEPILRNAILPLEIPQPDIPFYILALRMSPNENEKRRQY